MGYGLNDLLFVGGFAAMLLALAIGGLKAFGVEIWPLSGWRRLLALFVLGAALAAASFGIHRWERARAERRPPPTAPLPADAQDDARAMRRNQERLRRDAADGYIFLGVRNAEGWAPTGAGPAGAVTGRNVPAPGDIVKTLAPTPLLAKIRYSHEPPPPGEASRLIPAGTRLRVESVSRIEPGGYYWAKVDVLGAPAGSAD